MSDSTIPLNSGTGGKNLDSETLTGAGAAAVERTRQQIAGAALLEVAAVKNSAPGGTEYALVTRNIPGGTQTVAGTVAISGTTPVSGTVAVTGVSTETTSAAILAKLPSTPALEHATAASPSAARLSDGAAFYKATTPSDTQPVSIASSVAVTGPLTDIQVRATPLPVSGTVATTGTYWQTTQPVSIAASVAVTGPATDTQLRATPLPVSGTVTATGPLTDTQLRAVAVPVSGPLTDAQLRAATVPVSGTVTASGPVTDVQIRATPLPVSGTVTAAQATAASLNATVVAPSGAALALDATLTSGAQKAISRGGAKGATAAADMTSTAEGADHQAADVQVYHGGVAVNPQTIRALTSADVVTAVSATAGNLLATVTQGTAAAASGAWMSKVTDGTTVAFVTPASTAAVAANPALAVALHPTSPLPTGSNTIGALTANQSVNIAQIAGAVPSATNPEPVRFTNGTAFFDPTTQAGALFVQPRQLIAYRAVFRLSSRPYALSFAFAGAGRKQYATIFHGAGAAKLVKLRRVTVTVESTSAAAIVGAELVRLTNASTPATGNPAISSIGMAPGDSGAEATCLALPTTAGTESAVILAMAEWNLGITGTGSVLSPPPPLTEVVLYDDRVDAERKPPAMRAGNAEGYAVTIDASAATTVKGFVTIEFTEE